MSDLIISPHDVNGHRSASQRREIALREQLRMLSDIVDHLKAVLIVALEQRGGVPLLVLASKRIEILNGKRKYVATPDPNGDVTYALPPEPEPACAPAVELKT